MATDPYYAQYRNRFGQLSGSSPFSGFLGNPSHFDFAYNSRGARMTLATERYHGDPYLILVGDKYGHTLYDWVPLYNNTGPSVYAPPLFKEIEAGTVVNSKGVGIATHEYYIIPQIDTDASVHFVAALPMYPDGTGLPPSAALIRVATPNIINIGVVLDDTIKDLTAGTIPFCNRAIIQVQFPGAGGTNFFAVVNPILRIGYLIPGSGFLLEGYDYSFNAEFPGVQVVKTLGDIVLIIAGAATGNIPGIIGAAIDTVSTWATYLGMLQLKRDSINQIGNAVVTAAPAVQIGAAVATTSTQITSPIYGDNAAADWVDAIKEKFHG